jgi:hypothetical protein
MEARAPLDAASRRGRQHHRRPGPRPPDSDSTTKVGGQKRVVPGPAVGAGRGRGSFTGTPARQLSAAASASRAPAIELAPGSDSIELPVSLRRHFGNQDVYRARAVVCRVERSRAREPPGRSPLPRRGGAEDDMISVSHPMGTRLSGRIAVVTGGRARACSSAPSGEGADVAFSHRESRRTGRRGDRSSGARHSRPADAGRGEIAAFVEAAAGAGR